MDTESSSFLKYPKLKGEANYKTWKRSTELHAGSKNLLSYINGIKTGARVFEPEAGEDTAAFDIWS